MTIGQQIKWDFKTNGDLKIKDKNSKIIYFEDSSGYWLKVEYDSKSNEIYREHSDGEWVKREYDSEGNVIYFEDSTGFWTKLEYDSQGNQIYLEDSDGKIITEILKSTTDPNPVKVK